MIYKTTAEQISYMYHPCGFLIIWQMIKMLILFTVKQQGKKLIHLPDTARWLCHMAGNVVQISIKNMSCTKR